MPFVRIYLRQGKNEEYRRAVAEEVHHALVAEAGVPADDRFQIVHEIAPGDFYAHPSYGEVERTDDLIIVEITLNSGRTVEIKKALYHRIVRNLEQNPGVRPDDILVSLVEVAKENWSFGRGKATYSE